MKKNVALLAGGDSGEYEVSIRSANSTKEFMDTSKFDVFTVHIKGMNWHCIHNGKKYSIDKNNFSLPIDNGVIFFDIAFIMIHGRPGEDGKLQGYLDMMKIPYTSCNAITSALTFNKYLCNGFVRNLGVNVAQSVWISKRHTIDYDNIIEKTGLPCFVKPNCGGSSVGMTKVTVAAELPGAIELAFKEDGEVLIESFKKGIEITCGVVTINNQIIALPLCEVRSKKDYFDFEAKYNEKLADELVPAPISRENTLKCQELSVDLYKKLDCKGVVRFDYILDEQDVFNFLEVNTVPGMSAESIVPKMVKSYGLSLTQFYSILIEESLAYN